MAFLTLCMLGINSADDILKYFFLFFRENRIWHFIHSVSYRINLHELSNPIRVLTRILKVGVRDSLFIKSRSPSQKVGVPLPKNRSPIFFFFFPWLSFNSEHVPANFILLIPNGESVSLFSHTFCVFFFTNWFWSLLCFMYYYYIVMCV